jgi:peptide/nickel transport system substrate-binding protein
VSEYWQKFQREHRSRRRFLGGATGAAAGVAALTTVGCAPADDPAQPTPTPPADAPAATPTPAEQPRRGGTWRTMGGATGVRTVIDIHRTNTWWESAFLWHWCGNFLVRWHKLPPHLVEPDLAAALPEITDGGTTLIFKLRPEAKWQNRAPVNGRQVTAEDVKASFERIMNPDTLSPRRGNYADVDSIEAVDATTVRFKLKVPKADLLNAMSDQYDLVIPQEIAARGRDAITTVADVIGSGPYEATTFEAGTRIEVRRRPDGYWKPNTAWLDGAWVVHQPDNTALVSALRANQIDSVGLPPDLARQFEGDPNYYIAKSPHPVREVIMINHTLDRYKDVRVRQAIWRAVDRKAVYEQAHGGGGIPGGAMTPAAPAWVLPDAELARLPGFGNRADEVREARALLSAAGFPDGFDETIMTVTASLANVATDVYVSNLREVGIRLTVENVGTDFATMLRRQRAGEFNLSGSLILTGPYPDAQLLLKHHSDPAKGTRNYSRFADPEVDRLLDQQSSEFDYERRRAIVWDIQRKLAERPGPAWVGSRITFFVVSQRLRNVFATPFASGYAFAEDVWMKA